MKLRLIRGVYLIPFVGGSILLLGFQNCTRAGSLDPVAKIEIASSGLSSKVGDAEKVLLEGSVEAVYEDYPDGSHKLKHYLKEKSGKTYEIQTEHGLAVSAMSFVKVKGKIKKNKDSSESIEVAAEDTGVFAYNEMPTNNPFPYTYTEGLEPYSIGEQKTLVLLINFIDNPVQEITLEQGQQWLASLDAYIREGSRGKAWVTGQVSGWYTLNLTSADCNSASSGNIASQANVMAFNNGVALSNFHRIIYAHTKTACAHAGSGSLGGTPTSSFINGRLNETGTLFHEFGHNLGIGHSPSMYCKVGGPLGPGCSLMVYGDILDVMGKSSPGQYGAYAPSQKMYMGWLDSSEVTEVTTDGVYNIIPYADVASGKAKVLRIAKPGDPGYWFHINLYQPIGFDELLLNNWLANTPRAYENLVNGIVVREATTYQSALMDLTPDSVTTTVSDDYDPALTVGKSYQDIYSGIKLTTDSVSLGGAAVRVEFTGQRSCRSRPPSISYASSSVSGMPGAATEVAITINSPSSLDCGDEAMTLGAEMPEGWIADFGTMPLVVKAGSKTSYKFTVTPSATAAYGTYYPFFWVESGSGSSYQPPTNNYRTELKFYVSSTPPVNKAPVAVNDNVTITAKAAVTVSVLANDYDPEGKPLTIVAVGRPSTGSVAINSDGTITYTPSTRFKSADSFSYTISDGNSTRSAYVYVTLSGGSSGGGGGKGGRK